MPKENSFIQELDVCIERGMGLIEASAEFAKSQIPEKRFKGDSLAHLIRAPLSTIYSAETTGRLPAPDRAGKDGKGARLGYTFAQAFHAMDVLGTRPGRKEGFDDAPVTISFTNFKGGCWKTTTSWYFSSWLGSQGYRVLAVDLDPQASLTRNFSYFPDLDTNYDTTMAPFIMEDVDIEYDAVKKVIRPTHLPTVDLLPSSLDLQGVEWALARAVMEEPDVRGKLNYFMRVGQVISAVADDYDVIVLDGTPSLGLLPMNIVVASNSVIVPVPTEIVDFHSTMAFLRLVRTHFAGLIEIFGENLPVPQMLYLPTRFNAGVSQVGSASQKILDDYIVPTFRESLVAGRNGAIRKHDAVVGRLTPFCRTAFDSPPAVGDVRKEFVEKACENYEEVFNRIMELAVFPMWESVAVSREATGISEVSA